MKQCISKNIIQKKKTFKKEGKQMTSLLFIFKDAQMIPR